MEKIYLYDNTTHNRYFIFGVSSISPTETVEVTEYPTSEGTNMSDHAYNSPSTLNMTFAIDSSDQSNKSYCITSDGETIPMTYERTKNLLNTWMENGTLINIQTLHGYYKNMIMVSKNWSEEERSWTVFKPTIGFKEVRIAQLQILTLASLNLSVLADNSLETSTGSNNGNECDIAGEVGGFLGATAAGAGLGACIGSIFPVIGTGVGAVVGGAVGFVGHLFSRLF